MGHNRSMRVADSAVPRARRSIVDCSKRSTSQPNISVHTVPLVCHLRHWVTVVLPQFTGNSGRQSGSRDRL